MTSLSPKSLLSALETLTSNPPASLLENHILKTKLRLAARDLSLALETPADALARVLLSQPVESVCIRIAWDLDLFHLPSTGEKTLEQLAQATEADGVLLAYRALPGFLADTKYKNPTNPQNTAVQTAFHHPNKDLSGILGEKPDTAQAFATLMGTWAEGTSLVQDLFPIARFLAEGDSSISALWVEVGGGYGQKTVAPRAAFPELEGQFVVQDLLHIVSGAGRNEGIEYLVHVIFEEQPVKGARAYYIRQVLHDFPDDKCVVILTRLRKAMKPGYSKLFIHEQIVPRSGASVWAVTQDFNMMTLLGAAERTRDCFVDMLSRAGLRVLGFYPTPDGVSEGLVEVEVE
ncbi:uncharacterized protein EAE98_008694 [Botrytis deweyae]|uniref:O-methyltransferase C-terminal domain-containing protein n=1 Tax=Botrytis deweyae TaxID=2478750 RepID=A0ABQ7IDV4_9HELO|nr:uncharacterized protein EAE98_008694 [Botrytis deweyae]KAF7921268.1 hypothetical protein EAE98_008694 [Botrytis deweyae]